MNKSKCNIDQTLRHRLSLEEASVIRIPEYVWTTLRDNENTITVIEDGVYSGHIVRFSQSTTSAYFFIHIKLANSYKVFKGKVDSCYITQPICELYNHFANDYEIAFMAAIGAQVKFTVSNYVNDSLCYSNITNITICDSSEKTSSTLDLDYVNQRADCLNDDD